MTDWEDLRHFAAFARDGTLSAAARRLGVDHATVARRIAALETALDLKLLDRRARAHALTAEGARIAERAACMEEAAFALERAARALKPGLAGRVTISAPPALAGAMIAPRLGTLRRRHPDIEIRLIGEQRTASLARREADLAIRLSRPEEPGLVARRIGRMGFALYAAPDYLVARPPAAYEFIAYDESMETVPQQRWLSAIAGARPIVLRSNDLESQRAAARAGVGIAALPLFLGEGDGRLRRLAAEKAAPSREVWLVVHGDLRPAPPVRAVMDFLAECFRSVATRPRAPSSPAPPAPRR